MDHLVGDCSTLSGGLKAPDKVDEREEVTQRPGGGASLELGHGMCSAFSQRQMGAKGLWPCVQTFFCTALRIRCQLMRFSGGPLKIIKKQFLQAQY